MRYGDYFHVAVHDCECSRRASRAGRSTSSSARAGSLTVRHPDDARLRRSISTRSTRRFELQRCRAQRDRGGLPALGDLRRDRRPLLRRDRHDRRPARRHRGERVPGRRDVQRTGIVPQRSSRVRSDLDDVPPRRGAAAGGRQRDHPQGDRRSSATRRIVHFHDVYDHVLRGRATSSRPSATCSPACSRPTSR